MKKQDIVTGQRVTADKRETAKRLRLAQTPAEELLWQRLRANRLGGLHFRRQQVIDGYIVDFYCHAAGVVIELDGPVHKSRREEDAYRDAVLRGRGLAVFHIANGDLLKDIDAVLVRILAAIGTPLPVSGSGRGREKSK